MIDPSFFCLNTKERSKEKINARQSPPTSPHPPWRAAPPFIAIRDAIFDAFGGILECSEIISLQRAFSSDSDWGSSLSDGRSPRDLRTFTVKSRTDSGSGLEHRLRNSKVRSNISGKGSSSCKSDINSSTPCWAFRKGLVSVRSGDGSFCAEVTMKPAFPS